MSPLLLLAACTTTELSESWRIDRLRVLAVAAEPAEPRPGDTVTFSSLVVSPGAPVAATVWFACLTDDDTFGCPVDESLLEGLDPSALEPDEVEALYEAGFIGAEPYLSPTWTVPADALDALDADARLEGRTAIVNITAIPDLPEPTTEDLELAFKRIPVSEAPTPNHNPTLTAIAVDGVPIPAGTEVSVDRGQPYTVTVDLAEDAVETYEYRNEAGETETRTEEPYLSWYAEQGSFDRTFDLYPYTDAVYHAPEAPEAETGGLWVVVRDRRGGMAWASLTLRYR